ncbi:MAG: hypothetical protein IJT79_07660 [Ruminococcus sp.]|nr:hypothetical protein [Ruminococcus sp.]
MTKILKRPLSIILAVLMVMSLFVAVPITASANVGDVVPESEYLTFTALEDDSSVMMSVQSGSDFKYNKNGDGWHDYNINDYERIYLNKGEYVRFRGSNTISNYAGGNFSISRKVAASGNIMSLRLDSESRSQGLTDECFHMMFERCYGLITAPELPETTLAEYCYEGMFNKCTNLTTAPELPATALTRGCYSDMFNGCTSLTEAPKLPATSLAYGCYHGMFEGCTSLTELPELPATSLAEACYYGMFDGCSSIRISNVAGTINGIKYSEEYKIPTEGTATNASYALNSMFANTGGRFKGTPSINTTYYIGKPVYTVTWKNGDNVIEEDTDVESGAAPSFDGETPEKAEDETNTYTFSGWSDGNTTYGLSDTLPAVSGDVTYTAQFTSTPKHVHEWDYDNPVWGTPTGDWSGYTVSVTLKCKDDETHTKTLTAGQVGMSSEYAESCIDDGYTEANFSVTDDGHTLTNTLQFNIIPATGEHEFTTHHPAVAATCTTDGNEEYWECDVCGKYFSDAACTHEIEEDSWILPAGHTDLQHVAAQAATFEADGNIEYWYCSGCDKYFSDAEGTTEITQASTVIAQKVAVAQVGSTKYESLQEAIAAAADGDTIKLLADQTIDLQLAAGEEYTIDLNSYTLTVESPQNYYNYIYGNLTIDDSSAAKTGKVVVDDYGIAPRAGGKVTVNSGSFTTADDYPYIFYLMGGELEVNGGTFTAVHPVNCYASGKTVLGGTVVINDGEFTSTEDYVISGFENSNITINGGSFTGPNPVFVGKASKKTSGFTPASATINAGTFTATNDTPVVGCAKGASVVIKGGTFTDGELSADSTSEISVSGGTFDRDVDIYAAPGFVGKQLSATTFGVEVDPNPLGTAPIIGFQKKAADAEHDQGVRIITKVEGCDLTQFDEYGYVVAKVSGKEQATANFSNMKAYGGNGEKTIKCNGTVNTIDGYGTPYVTLAVNGMSDGQQVAARFYAIKDGVTYYSNYVSTARYNGIIATY